MIKSYNFDSFYLNRTFMEKVVKHLYFVEEVVKVNIITYYDMRCTLLKESLPFR